MSGVRWRVVVTDSSFDGLDLEREELGEEVTLCGSQARTAEEVIAAGTGADGLLVQWAPVTAEVLSALPNTRAVVRYGIGLDNIDLAAAERFGVRVGNVVDYCTAEVATHAVAMILGRTRRLGVYDAGVKAGRWEPTEALPAVAATEVVGVVGLGRIGRVVARSLAGLGYRVLFWDPFRPPGPALPGVEEAGSLEELAEVAGHVTLHVPAGPETAGLVGRSLLRRLGPDGHLVNTARGALVDEVALLQALEERTLGWASLDVLANEPPAGVSAQLAAHPRVTMSPHVAYRSAESEDRLRRSAARLLRNFLEEDGHGR